MDSLPSDSGGLKILYPYGVYVYSSTFFAPVKKVLDSYFFFFIPRKASDVLYCKRFGKFVLMAAL